jgi:hypothetical protein
LSLVAASVEIAYEACNLKIDKALAAVFAL